MPEPRLAFLALPVLGAALAVAVASCAVVRGVGMLLANVGHAPHGVERLRRIVDDLPRIATDDKATVLLVGSSVTAWGVDPDVVDAELHQAHHETTTFNLGVAAMFPYEQAQFVHRVAKDYVQRGRHAAAIVLEVSPELLFAKPNPQRQSLFAVILDSAGELFDHVLTSPEEGFRMFGRRYALGGVSGPELTYRVKGWFDDSIARWFGGQTELERQDALQPGTAPWSFERRGSPVDPALMARYAEWMEATRARRAELLRDDRRATKHHDQVAEGVVLAVIAAATDARQISPRVLLWIPPANPCLPTSEDDAAEVLTRIARESGAQLFRLSEPLACDDFEDLVHFERRTGIARVSAAFGRALAAVL